MARTRKLGRWERRNRQPGPVSAVETRFGKQTDVARRSATREDAMGRCDVIDDSEQGKQQRLSPARGALRGWNRGGGEVGEQPGKLADR